MYFPSPGEEDFEGEWLIFPYKDDLGFYPFKLEDLSIKSSFVVSQP
jgi:hypothetical protein